MIYPLFFEDFYFFKRFRLYILDYNLVYKEPTSLFSMSDDRLEEFKKHMKEEFARIPRNLSVPEMRDRSERCLAMAASFTKEDERFKAKKYELLAQKYKQLAYERAHPSQVENKQTVPIYHSPVVEELPVKQSKIKVFFARIFGKSKDNKKQVIAEEVIITEN